MLHLVEFKISPNIEIYSYVNERGINLVEEYITSLTEYDKNKIKTRIDFFIKRNGIMFNKEQFQFLEKGVYEFKIHGHRILCYFMPNTNIKTLVLTHGFPKRTSEKTPKKEINKAITIREIISSQNTTVN